MPFEDPFKSGGSFGFGDPWGGSRYSDVLLYGSNLRTSPETVGALATYGAQPNEVQAVAGTYEAQRLVQHLTNLPDAEAITVYNALPVQQKQLLALAKYAPPRVEGKQGFFGRVLGNIPYVSDAAENLIGGAGKVISAPLAPVLDAFNAAENFKDRLFRTAYRVNDYQITTEDEGSAFSLGTWSRAWREVEDGESTFDLAEYDEIVRSTSEQTMLAAYNLAKGETPEEVLRFLMARGLTPQEATELTFSAETADVVARLDRAKVSFGRLVGDLIGDPQVDLFGRKVGLTSGFFDGLDAVLLDPTLVGTKVTSVVKVARWGVKGADIGRLDALMQTEAAARGWNRVGSQLETLRTADNAADKAQAFDRIANEGLVRRDLVQPLLDAGVKDVDSARVWMLNARNALDIVAGGRGRQLLPGRLTRSGEAWLNSKNAVRERIDWALDGPKLLALSTDSPTYDAASAAAARNEQLRGRIGGKGPLTPQARLARLGLAGRRLSTKVPERTRLRISHPESAFEIQRAALMTGMPKYWADEIAAAYLVSPHGVRRRIEKGMLSTLMEHASNGSDSMRAWWAQYVDNADELADNRAYGIGGRDVKLVNGLKRSLAIRSPQLTDAVAMPSFTEAYGQSARMGMLDRMGAATHRDAAEWYNSRVFRPGVLLRPALAVRNILEEDFSHILRNGARELVQARAALSATTTAEGRLVRTLTSSLDPADVDRFLNNPTTAELTKATLRQRLKSITIDPAAKGKRTLAKRLGGSDMEQYLDELSTSSTAQNALSRSAVLNTERGGMGYVQQEREILQKVRRGGKMVTVSLTEAGSYRQRPTAGLEGATRLHRQLVDILDAPESRLALEMWDDPAAVERVADFILSDDFKVPRAMSERMIVDPLPEGLTRAAAERAAAVDWANVILGDIRDHVVDADGNVVDELLEPLRRGEVPDIGLIDALERKPPHVVSRDVMLLASPENILSNITQYGFGKIGEWVDWAARQPIFLANYGEARRAQSGIEAALIEQMGEKAAKRALIGRATETAIEDTLKFVDNPDVRAQSSVIMRNLVPFWRAQEEFYTRWAKTLVHRPDAIRKGQLLMHGMRHMGFVQKDNQGRDYFVYPLPAVAQNAIRAVFGAPDLGVAYQFRGQVTFLNQGLDPRGVVPQVGPLVSIPLNLLAEQVPETGSVVAAIVGEQGIGRSPIDAITPTLVRRAWDVVGRGSDQMASAKLQFIQAAAAEDPDGSKGLFLRPDASREEQQLFMQRAERWARHIAAMRFMVGLAAPASPQAGELAPLSALQRDGMRTISDEFRAMLNSGIPFEEAMSAFIARHPDGQPWTVSKTESTVTGYLPATDRAEDWLKDNRGLAQTYKRLVPFLIPADPGEFDPNAFRLELAYGLRQRKTGEEFYGDIALSGVLGTYYDAKERKDKALSDAMAQGHSALASEIRRTWSVYLADFRAANPLFADWQAQSVTRVRERENILIDWKNAAVSGDIPDTQSAKAITAMVAARDTYVNTLSAVLGRRDDAARRYRDTVEGTYLAYQRQVAATDPNAKAFYDRVIAPLDEG